MKPKPIYEMNETDIYHFIEGQLPIKKKEKDKYGEVFTSPILINKMLDLFPHTVWSNPKLKWLDPAVGSGGFMLLVYLRLMEGLKRWQTNKQKRSNHIISNMLHMVELNKKNCNICRNLFGPKVQLICDDFLKDTKTTATTAITTIYDCIVGNPPYQDDYGLTKEGARISGGKSKLYERFFLKSIDMLRDNGYLAFVVPDNIFAGNGSKSYQTILQNHVPFVSFNPKNQDYFSKIQQPVCYFLLHKTNKPGTTVVEHDDTTKFNIQLKNRPANPIRNWTLKTDQLVDEYIGNERNDVSYVRGQNVESYQGNKYPIIFKPNKLLHTNDVKLAFGLGKKKAIVFSISPDLEFKMDYSGKYGAGPNTFIIPFHNAAEGRKLESFLRSDVYKVLANATKTTRQYLKLAFVEYLKLTKVFQTRAKYTRKRINKKNKTKKIKRI